MSLAHKIQDIHLNVDQLVNKFEKAENTKALENQIQKCFKEVRQLVQNDGKEAKEELSRIMIEKEEKTKYIIQCKKGLYTKQLKETHLKKINEVIEKINKKINEFQKNVTSQTKQNNRRKKSNYQKNIQFLRYHLGKMEVLKNNLETNKLYSVQNIDALFDYLADIFLSLEDTIFQQDIQKCYITMFVLAEINQSDIGQITSKAPATTQAVPPSNVSSAPATAQQSIRTKQQFADLMALSYQNLPKWNDYIPSKEIKDTQQSKGIFPDYKMVDFSTISKMKDETLFFIFYYMKGEMEQYFAAKQLKNRHWRYNTKYLNWFRRYGEPTLQMPEYQKATYIFFDYDKFSNRKRADFTMKFHQLEDKI